MFFLVENLPPVRFDLGVTCVSGSVGVTCVCVSGCDVMHLVCVRVYVLYVASAAALSMQGRVCP